MYASLLNSMCTFAHVFFCRCPNAISIKRKMLYASSKDALKKVMSEVTEFQADCADDLQHKDITSKVIYIFTVFVYGKEFAMMTLTVYCHQYKKVKRCASINGSYDFVLLLHSCYLCQKNYKFSIW